jgi:hypothetical protein
MKLAQTFIKTIIQFKVDGQQYKFAVVHDLPKIPGLSIEDALVNWLARTDEYTAESFCEYINDKPIEYSAMTEEEFEKLNK